MRERWMRAVTVLVMGWVLAAVLSCAGCVRKSSDSTISLSSWGDLQEAAILGDLCRMFEAENPGVKVQLQRVPYGEYSSKILSQFAAGVAPDVLFLGGGQVVEYHPRGVLEPLGPYLEKDPVDLKAYYPQSVEPFRLGDLLYGLPRDIAPIACVFYNKDLFRKHGVPFPKDDWNWDGLLAAAQKLTLRDAKGTVTCWGYTEDWLSADTWVLSSGGDWVDDWRNPGRYTVADPAFLRGIQMRVDLMYKHRVTPTTSAVNALAGGTTDLFLSGKAGMFFSGIWKAPLFRGIQTFDWDVAMFPKGPTGKRGFVLGGAGYGICSRSKNKDIAWKLVKFLAGEKAQIHFAKSGLAQPAMAKVADSPAFLGDQKPLNKRMLIEAVRYGHWQPMALNWREVLEGTIGPTLDRVWNGQWTPRQGLIELDRKLKDKPLQTIEPPRPK